MRRLRGLKSLVHDAVDRVTELVSEGHESTARSVMKVLESIEPLAEPARALNDIRRFATEGTLATIRAVNRAVEVVTDAGIDAVAPAAASPAPPPETPLVPMRSDVMKSAAWIGDAALGLVNGAIGDTLHARDNGLDLGMWLRRGDAFLPEDPDALRAALGDVGPRLAIFVHGLGATEWSWCLAAEQYHGDASACIGTLLQRDLGHAPIFARYNTGRHVSENGLLLSRAIERLIEAIPAPAPEIVLFGHSMGGLVVRSACHQASVAGLPWVKQVKSVFCLGSPHHGAPLEKVGHVLTAVLDAIDTPGTRIPARILQGRSAGIKDLRHGTLVDDDWLGRDLDAIRDEGARDIPLLPDARYHFLSATITRDPDHPVAQIIGDLLVRVPSAIGERLTHAEFPIETSRFGGIMHHQLQNHPALYAQIKAALSGPAPVSSRVTGDDGP